MIEVLRYALAMIVANEHLWPIGIPSAGSQSVFAFYTLSGYLMTRVLRERYGFSLAGRFAFIANRVLRLWPAYLVVVAATAIALRFFPLQNFFFSLIPPRSPLEQVTLLTILGQVGFDFLYLIPMSRLAVTSWSLSIEIFCYCLLAFYFAKTRARLVTLAVMGAVGLALSTGYCIANPSPFYGPYCGQNRYGVLQAGFIPFATGGLIWIYRDDCRRWLATHWKACLSGLVFGEALATTNFFGALTIGPFLGVAIMGGILTRPAIDRRPSMTVDFVGRASYHLFIAHMSIAAVLVTALHLRANSGLVFLLSIGGSLLLSAGLVPLEWRINRLRERISAASRRRGLVALA